ncbi:phage protease [Endozoicomonas gorgoniicola]|uniref:Phage protease n=1 Tax=Endozoicomonas gorgoniicola TaxID=1234144 RepID=A0ABT3MT94_9GAMM|nr:phage protease [Endozoicomonas gorgoniicola]MCW7552588.1 phage protease [Endozoicomonas gorgoniicola]
MNAFYLALNSEQEQDHVAVDLALNFQLTESGQAPEWLPLIPAGQFSGQDGRTWHNSNPEAVLARTRNVGRDVPWDIEHATELKGPKGEAAPAQAWIKLSDLEVRDGAIWGRVEWNDSGRQLVEGKSYKYYSPAFYWNDQGEVVRIKSVGLTNSQNLPQLPALNHEKNNPQKGEADMPLSEAMRSALSLKEDATEAEAVQAIGKLKSDHQLALNRAETPDADKFVPKADYELALNRATTAETSLKSFQDKEVEAEVDAAIKAGKVAPASKDYHLATCRQEGGLERFKSFVESAPQIVSTEAGKGGKKPEGTRHSKLTDEQLALCRQSGVSEEEFLSSLDDCQA